MSDKVYRAVKLPSIAELVAQVGVPLLRNAYALLLSDAVTSALGFVYWIIAARAYPAEDVGLNSAAIATMLLLSGVSQLNLMGVLLRFVPRAGQATARLIAYAYLGSLTVAAVVSLGFILGSGLLSGAATLLPASLPFRVWFATAIMAWGIFALQDSAMTGLRQAVWVPIENIAFGVAKIVLLVAFSASFQHYGVFISWTLPVAVSLVPVNGLIFGRLIPRHIRATEGQAERIMLSHVVRYLGGDYLGFLFHLLTTSLLPLLVTYVAGARANAYFYLPWTLAYALQLVALNMALSLTVEGATDRARLDAYSRQTLIHIARLLVPLVGIILIAAPYILAVFGRDYAAEGALLLRLLALAALPNVVNVISIAIARVQRRVARVASVRGALCLLTLGLGYPLLRRYGIAGIGAAWLTSQTVVAAAVVLARFLGRNRASPGLPE
jgi:O-antigen/teichoic acid export membrane protein